jgi:pyruvate dehydrogenase (quinone)
MAKTVADQFAEILAAASVKRVYGIVGDSLNGLTDALRHQGKVEWIHVRHEEVAAFAAGAEAHLTGELAVCAGSCARTCTHRGLSTATARGSARHRGPDTWAEIGAGIRETHLQTLFQECSHYCERSPAPTRCPGWRWQFGRPWANAAYRSW